MLISVDIFWLQKEGNHPEEFEDAFCPVESEYKGQQFRCAIADGASSGMLSREWARILTKTFYKSSASFTDIPTIFYETLTEWKTWIQEYLRTREEQNKPIKWYEEPGLREGAFATLLALELNGDGPAGEWQAIAIGDSCLFQIRQDQLLARFPIRQSEEFNNSPALVRSIPTHNDILDDKFAKLGGEWQIDDQFYLMTDALAHWFLNACEKNQLPWRILRDLKFDDQEQTFKELVAKWRMSRIMRNDDVTLVRITVM